MLGKLIKYEFKSTAKWFLPLYLFTLIMAPLTRLLISIPLFENKYLHIIPNLFSALFVISIIALVLVTFFLIVFRFYKSMITDEGYLTHTLPVTPTALIASKLIASMLWAIFAGVVAIAALLMLFLDPADLQSIIHAFSSSNMAPMLAEFQKEHISFTLLMVGCFVGLLLGICYSIIRIYAAIAMGQLFNTQKLLASFASYFVLGFVSQIIGVICLMIPIFSNSSLFENAENMGYVLNYMMLFGIGFEVILISIYFVITNYIFKKKLNLE